MPVAQSAKTGEIADIDQKVLQVKAMVQFGLPVTNACMKAGLSRRTFYYRLEREKPADDATGGSAQDEPITENSTPPSP